VHVYFPTLPVGNNFNIINGYAIRKLEACTKKGTHENLLKPLEKLMVHFKRGVGTKRPESYFNRLPSVMGWIPVQRLGF